MQTDIKQYHFPEVENRLRKNANSSILLNDIKVGGEGKQRLVAPMATYDDDEQAEREEQL